MKKGGEKKLDAIDLENKYPIKRDPTPSKNLEKVTLPHKYPKK